MKNREYLSVKEQHTFSYMSAKRLGRLESSREIFLRVLNRKGREQGVTVSKETTQKINREIEDPLLNTLIFNLLDDKLTVEYIDKNYDRLFLMPNDKKDSYGDRILAIAP